MTRIVIPTNRQRKPVLELRQGQDRMFLAGVIAPVVIISLAGLIVGGKLLLCGAGSAAKFFGIPTMVIGQILVGFGTPTLKLVTSLRAVPDLILQNLRQA